MKNENIAQTKLFLHKCEVRSSREFNKEDFSTKNLEILPPGINNIGMKATLVYIITQQASFVAMATN